MDEDGQFQDILKLTLDILGYNMKAIEKRRTFMQEMYKVMSQSLEPSISVYCAGSKAEGMTLLFENDMDSMYVFNDVVCVERDACSENLDAAVVFEMVLDKHFPGYTKLLLQKMEKDIPDIMEALLDDCNGNTCISSDFFARTVQKVFKQERSNTNTCISRSGPSCNVLTQLKECRLAVDHVICFRCECSTLLRKWSHRKRYQKWPTQDMIAHVNTLDSHVAPVGAKGHMLQFTQWRICFTLGETYLLNTLKENMLQVYAIMKELTSTVIKPVCSEVTSYIVKNIVLWMAETLPTDNLGIVPLLMKAILLLKLTVKSNYFPSYMIPERNLFQDKLALHQRFKLVILLTEMLQERGAMVLRSPRIDREMRFVKGQPELVDLRRLINEVLTHCHQVNNEVLQQISPIIPLNNSENKPLSLIDFINSGLTSAQKLILLSNSLENSMRLPRTTYLKLTEKILEKLDKTDMPFEITFEDVCFREELLDLNLFDVITSFLPEIMPTLLSSLGADDTNNDLLFTLMNHPEIRRWADNILGSLPISGT